MSILIRFSIFKAYYIRIILLNHPQNFVDRCNRRMKCEDDGEERRDFDEETMGRSDEKSGAGITKFSFLPMKAVKAREELPNIVSRRLK